MNIKTFVSMIVVFLLVIFVLLYSMNWLVKEKDKTINQLEEENISLRYTIFELNQELMKLESKTNPQ